MSHMLRTLTPTILYYILWSGIQTRNFTEVFGATIAIFVISTILTIVKAGVNEENKVRRFQILCSQECVKQNSH